jgi:multidrug efflux pump subunit AcrB
VLESLQQANQPLSLGTHDNGNERLVLTVSQEEGIEKLEQLQVGQAAVPLSEVAVIETVDQETSDIVTFEGEDAISYTVFLQTGQDVPSVDKRVTDVIEEFNENLPAGVQANKYESQADNVNEIFSGLYISLLIAVLAVQYTAETECRQHNRQNIQFRESLLRDILQEKISKDQIDQGNRDDNIE